MGTRFGDGRDGRRPRRRDLGDQPAENIIDADGIDDVLRGEFARSFPPQREADDALVELRPRLMRARRAGVARQVALGGVGIAVLVALAGLSIQLLDADTSRVQTGPAQSDRSGEVAGTTITTLRPGLPATSEQPDSGQGSASADPPSDDAEQATGTPTGNEPEPAVGDSTTISPTSSETTRVPTAPAEPVTVESACGSIVVGVDDGEVVLIDVIPGAASEPDIKNSGPDEVEVGFEGNGFHCELKAEMKDGKLETSVDAE